MYLYPIRRDEFLKRMPRENGIMKRGGGVKFFKKILEKKAPKALLVNDPWQFQVAREIVLNITKVVRTFTEVQNLQWVTMINNVLPSCLLAWGPLRETTLMLIHRVIFSISNIIKISYPRNCRRDHVSFTENWSR